MASSCGEFVLFRGVITQNAVKLFSTVKVTQKYPWDALLESDDHSGGPHSGLTPRSIRELS